MPDDGRGSLLDGIYVTYTNLHKVATKYYVRLWFFDDARIIFLSLHADSRKPSARGAMIYLPGSAYRKGRYGHTGSLYRRKEVEQARYVRFSSQHRKRSERVSRHLADQLITHGG